MLLRALQRRSDELTIAAGIVVLAVEQRFAVGVKGRNAGPPGDAAPLAQLEGNIRGRPFVARVQRDVEGDKKLAGADDRRPATRIENRRAAIGRPIAVAELRRQALVFAAADIGQILAAGVAGGGLVEIDRNAQLIAHAAADAASDRRALFQSDAFHWNEGANVGRARRGCSPRCSRISITSAALAIARNAASATASGVPMNVTTVRFAPARGQRAGVSPPAPPSRRRRWPRSWPCLGLPRNWGRTRRFWPSWLILAPKRSRGHLKQSERFRKALAIQQAFGNIYHEFTARV